MDASKSIWDLAGANANDFARDIASYVIGWALTLLITAIPLVILYFILKRLGYTKYWNAVKRTPSGELQWTDPQLAPDTPVESPAPAAAALPESEVPAWQREMIEQWQEEENTKRQRFSDSMQAQKTAALGIYRALGYAVVSVLVLGAAFFGVMAAWKKNPQLYIVTFVLLGAAGAAYSKWNPTE